jgi:hypothetical protein
VLWLRRLLVHAMALKGSMSNLLGLLGTITLSPSMMLPACVYNGVCGNHNCS